MMAVGGKVGTEVAAFGAVGAAVGIPVTIGEGARMSSFDSGVGGGIAAFSGWVHATAIRATRQMSPTTNRFRIDAPLSSSGAIVTSSMNLGTVFH